MVQREALETIAKLTTKAHAKDVRGAILKMVPQMQPTVRDTAEEVVIKLSNDFELAKLNINWKEIFETRLTKIDQTRAEEKARAADKSADATGVAKILNIEAVSYTHLTLPTKRLG